jgi:hypothetical protein
MKIVIRTVVFHIVCIIIFASIYSSYSHDFKSLDSELYNKKSNKYDEKRNFLDFILLSTTIQAGVGMSEFFPSSPFTKITMIIQQFIMISTHVFTLYIFTL